jgi:translation initiation factor IF-2
MAEEQEKKQQKKTALIKHRKPEGPASEPEKKKVVVIKKKVVTVKRSKVAAKSPVPERTETEKKRYLGRSPREPSPFDVQEGRTTPRAQRTTSTPSTPSAPRRESREARTTGPPASRELRQRPPRRQPPRPAPRSQAGRAPTATKEPPKEGAAKPGAKKFFKTKKRSGYQKRKEQQKEKMLQLKKKTVQRANPIPKEISILEAITVSELAKKMNLKASELIGKLMSMGMMVTINQQIDAETATILADEYGSKVNVVSLYEETVIEEEEETEEELRSRPPIITVMGHVDHGKTKLLDTIRTSNVVDTEYGGITQHIGAHTVELSQGKIVFLDTPGHEAFTLMRARGAQVTDIVVLVVAADDGVMPQTVEAINHAREAKVPIIVAINKIDLPDANADRVKQQLADHDLLPEEWGGHTLYAEVSALKNTGIDHLLDVILLQAEMMELKASYSSRAVGRVVESRVDHGRGIVSTVLIEKGTLKTGDAFIAGIYPGRVRAIFSDSGDKLEEATPAIPVEILGFTGLPKAGDPFHVTENEKTARQIGLKRQELKKMEDAQNVNKITLDNLYDQIKQGEVQELKAVVKGDVHGSVEALQNALEKLSTDEIRLGVVHASAGAINDNDVLLAAASNAIIVGFHVRPTPSAQSIADREKVEIRKYSVIYDVVNDIKAAMEGMLAPEVREELVGIAEVRELFKVPRVGVIAGSYIHSGNVARGSLVHVIRDGIEIASSSISSLRRFKEDVREVESGFECGIGLESYNDIKVGDRFEAFEMKEVAKKLEEIRKDVGDKKEKSREPTP